MEAADQTSVPRAQHETERIGRSRHRKGTEETTVNEETDTQSKIDLRFGQDTLIKGSSIPR